MTINQVLPKEFVYNLFNVLAQENIFRSPSSNLLPLIPLHYDPSLLGRFNIEGHKLLINSNATLETMLEYSQMPPTVPLLLLHACDIPNALEMAQLVTEISKNGKASSNCKQRIQTLQHLLRLARKSPYLTSELFLLLLKQTRGNPDEQEIVTILQLWLALSFCLPCPEGFRAFLHRHLVSLTSNAHFDGSLASAVELKERLLKDKATFLPCEQLNAFCDEIFESCQISIPDGTKHEIVYPSNATVEDVIDSMAHKCKLKNASRLVLFMSRGEKITVLDPKQTLSVVFDEFDPELRSLKVKPIFGTKGDIVDDVFEEWCYQQARLDFVEGWYPAHAQLLTNLCLFQIIESGTEWTSDNTELMRRIIESLPRKGSSEMTEFDWVDRLKGYYKEIGPITKEESKRRFLSQIEELEYGHSIFFPASFQKDELSQRHDEIWIGINTKGIHTFHKSMYRHLQSVRYDSISSCGFTECCFWIEFKPLTNLLPLITHTQHGESIFFILRIFDPELKIEKNEYELPSTPDGEIQVASREKTFKRDRSERVIMDKTESKKAKEIEVYPGGEGVSMELQEETSLRPKPQLETSLSSRQLEQHPHDWFDKNVIRGSPIKRHESLAKLLQKEQKKKYSFEKLKELEEGVVFANKYVITERVRGKNNIFFATSTYSKSDKFALKFFDSDLLYLKSKAIHIILNDPNYVCQMYEEIKPEYGYPPCLVFEKGDQTLEEFLRYNRGPRFSLIKGKWIFQDILECLQYVHSHKIVHCDIKPSNIMSFNKYGLVWKLVDFDGAVTADEECQFAYSLNYASPEVLEAAKRGLKKMAISTAHDMWSTGLVAYEIFTGNKYYGREDESRIKEDLRRKKEPSLDAIYDKTVKKLLESILKLEPRERRSAEHCLTDGTFKSPSDTMKEQQEKKNMEELLRMLKMNTEMLEASNLLIDVFIEEYSDDTSEGPFSTRPVRDALVMTDDQVTNPIFMLNVGKAYRIGASIQTKEQLRCIPKLKGMSVQPPDEKCMVLEVHEAPAESNHDLLGHFDLTEVASEKLSRVSPERGDPHEKYVMLQVLFEIEVGQDQFMKTSGLIPCKMIPKGKNLQGKRTVQEIQKKWRQSPVWFRNYAKGAIVLGKIAIRAAPVPTGILVPAIAACFAPLACMTCAVGKLPSE